MLTHIQKGWKTVADTTNMKMIYLTKNGDWGPANEVRIIHVTDTEYDALQEFDERDISMAFNDEQIGKPVAHFVA